MEPPFNKDAEDDEDSKSICEYFYLKQALKINYAN
jgi:hypothetical protein